MRHLLVCLTSARNAVGWKLLEWWLWLYGGRLGAFLASLAPYHQWTHQLVKTLMVTWFLIWFCVTAIGDRAKPVICLLPGSWGERSCPGALRPFTCGRGRGLNTQPSNREAWAVTDGIVFVVSFHTGRNGGIQICGKSRFIVSGNGCWNVRLLRVRTFAPLNLQTGVWLTRAARVKGCCRCRYCCHIFPFSFGNSFQKFPEQEATANLLRASSRRKRLSSGKPTAQYFFPHVFRLQQRLPVTLHKTIKFRCHCTICHLSAFLC